MEKPLQPKGPHLGAVGNASNHVSDESTCAGTNAEAVFATPGH
jgi:hypothetical protein